MKESAGADNRTEPQDLVDELEMARAALRAIPPMPAEQRAIIRQRIASGRYRQPDAVAVLARQVLRVLEAEDAFGQEEEAKEKDTLTGG